LTYEGNPWERAFIAGIRESNPGVRIVGYQHSVIPQVAANMFQSTMEMDNIPLPDVLLTTGNVPADILQKYGAFPKEKIKVSCALRYHYLDELQSQPRHRANGHGRTRILVALCGVVETLPLLRYAIDQGRSVHHVDFLVRAHPVLPFKQLQPLMDDKSPLPANITISNGTSVIEDMLECDAVLYWGSSVALEGIRLGKPAIHFDPGDFLSYDPLFDLQDFKWVITSESGIQEMLNHIDDIPENEFEELRDRAQRYVIAYHNPVSKDALSPFFVN
jgi:surface carbohydrate biosynthesis protein (TIGR04326 family)